MLQGTLDLANNNWAKLASGPASAEKLKHIQKQGRKKFLFQHPQANSLVLEILTRPGSHSLPLDKEGYKLYTLGYTVYASGTLDFRMASFTAIIGQYQVFLWE